MKVIRRLREEVKDKPKLWMVKLGDEREKGEVVGLRRRLRGRSDRIEEDWTWSERKVIWLLKQRAYLERKN